MKIKTFFLLLLFSASVFGQPLRKSVLSLAAGYVSGDNSLARNNSSQILFWGNYAFSSLDEISVVYKRFKFRQTEKSYSEHFYAVKGKLNFFPLFISASAGKLDGTFTPREQYPDASAEFYTGDVTLYNNLMFYTFSGEYVTVNWETKEKIYTGEVKITWRPTKYFAVTVGGGYSQSDYDSLYKSLSVEIFWQPLSFFNVSYKGYAGERRFYYDSDYMVAYNFPYTEKGARAVYLRFFPWRTLSVILNYEHRQYDLFAAEYYSLSLRYDFMF